MIKADLAWLQRTLVDAQVVNLSAQQAESEIDYVVTDSRSIKPGQVFVALKGEHFDGAKFVADVVAKGAIAVVVEEQQAVDVPQFIVADTLIAYGKIAAQVAQESNLKTIAVTGSSGKSTVREMCVAILQQRGQVVATEGNFNNEIGVPHTLMKFTPEYDYAVVELGANHQGEIAYTQALAQPDVAILNNVAEAHLEGFGGIEGVVKAKGEIFLGLQKRTSSQTRNGIVHTAVVNADSPYKQAWLTNLAEINTMQFSTEPSLAGQVGYLVARDVTLDAIGCPSFELVSQQQSIDITVSLPGKHNVANALAAASACVALGATLTDVQAGLAAMAEVKGRLNRYQVTEQLTFIDDSYNANVGSIKAAADLLVGLPSTSVLVLGDMAELGHESAQLHQEVGRYAKQIGVDYLFGCGNDTRFACQAFGQHAQHFTTKDQLIAALTPFIATQNRAMTLLFKGSRSSKMEQVFQVLFEQFNQENKKGR